MKLLRFLLGMFLFSTSVDGATYWVATNGSNGNLGTSYSPWATVQKSATNAVAGDIVRVRPGLYNERVSVSNSGSSGNVITFMAESGAIVRGFDLSGSSYIRITGWEITHGLSGYVYPAILLSSANYNEVVACNIHDVNSWGIRIGNSATFGHWNVIRNNRIWNTGTINGTNYDGNAAVYCFGNSNLIEYNVMGRCSDFVSGRGDRNVVRNNSMGDVLTNYFPTAAPHVDAWESQPVTTNEIDGTRFVLFERNWIATNLVEDSHAVLVQSTSLSTNDAGINTRDFIGRLNLIHELGSYTLIASGFPRVRWYNNTIHKANTIHDDGVFGCTVGVDKGSTNSRSWNNIYVSIGGGSTPVYLTDLSTSGNFIADNDLRYLTSSFGVTETNGISGDPLFIDSSSLDFSIASNSPAIGAARPQANAVGSGTNATVITVSDARAFVDGWGIVDGDLVVIGTNATVEVIGMDVDAGTLTVESAISWSNGDGVSLFQTEDVGSFKYLEDGYEFDVSISSPSAGSVGHTATVTMTVDNETAIRNVKVYVDGMEQATLTGNPWSTNVSVPVDGEDHVITATAFALYADDVPTISDSVTVTAHSPTFRANTARVGTVSTP